MLQLNSSYISTDHVWRQQRSEYKTTKRYCGPVKAVVFDWAGKNTFGIILSGNN